jgi:heavy metal efflux system protein
MIQHIIHFSISNKFLVLLGVVGLVVWGGLSLNRLPLDAIPDVTNNQVVVATQSPNLSAVEMEQFVTYPVETAMRNIQGLEGVRSVSQFGLSIVTLDFKEGVDIYFARNQVNERLLMVREEIPAGFGSPTMNPITTGLGEIYQYTIEPIDPTDTTWSPLELRTIQDWVVKKQLLGTEGVAEISSYGGYLKQYHVKADPDLLRATGCTLAELFESVEKSNENTGAAYLEKDAQNYFIRGLGLANDPHDLEQAVVKVNGSTPILVRDVATVEIGSAVRYGALTQDDHEAVGGIILMLKGENSRNVVLNIKKRLETVQLPKGLKIEAFLDRELLINRTIATVSLNLLEGGLIVVFVLVLLLGHLRAGLVVASVIPLSMLFAVGCMVAFGVSGNLMSLGAIDFGLLVDGAVIIVENIISRLAVRSRTDNLQETPLEQEATIANAATNMAKSSFFGQLIILIVYVPLLTLSGIEGKMFKPMALTVIFALAGAVLLSLTYIPALSALAFKGQGRHEVTFADRLMHTLMAAYRPVLAWALRWKKTVVVAALLLLGLATVLFSRMGGEFIPQLDEGDFVIELRMLPGASLNAMIHSAQRASDAILKHFPDEVITCTGKIGTSEVALDPMSIEELDMVLTMHPREAWKKVKNRAAFEAELEKVLDEVPGIFTSIQQPIAMRFNELMSGAKTDVVVKVLGPDLEQLAVLGNQVVREVNKVEGAQDVSLVKAEGLPQLFVEYRRDALARYGISVREVNTALQTAIAGRKAGMLFEGNRRFDVIVKLRDYPARPLDAIEKLMLNTPDGTVVPLTELADVGIKEGPMAVNRVDGERCVNVSLNVRGRDIASVVAEVQGAVGINVKLPEGYRISYGGQFENLQNAQARLRIVVPAALLLILALLYFSLGSIRDSLLIFSAIPFAAVGGVLVLWLFNMPFSISAGVGFIALFGVAVLNGLVLIGYFQQLEKEGQTDVYTRIQDGVAARFRPVMMTAAVASLGFLPMAIATGAGAEVQKPLATVVIGGLISATLLTLIILPVLYALFANQKSLHGKTTVISILVICCCFGKTALPAQSILSENEVLDLALKNHPALQKAQHTVEEKAVLSRSKIPLPHLQAYTWLPFNPEVGVTQNFDHPALVKAERRVREGQLAFVTAERDLTAQSVRREVTLAYNHCRYRRERLRLLTRQDSLLADYRRIAELEYQTGNISALSKLTIEARSREAGRAAVLALLDYRAALGQLRLITGNTDTTWMPEPGYLMRIATTTKPEWLSIWGQQRQQLAQLDLTRQQKTLLPGFGVGVVTNVDPVNRFLPNAYVSLNIPLFRKGYRAEIEAARIRQNIAADEVALLDREAALRRQKAEQQLQTARTDLAYWENTGRPQATELLRAAELSRKAGEATATEYLQATGQAFLLEISYLEAIHLFNEAVIGLDFWQIP